MYPAENRQATSSKQKRDRRRIFASGFCGLFHRKSKSPASPSTTTPHAGTSAAGSQVQIDVKKPEATVKEAITESRELPHRKPPTYPEPSLQVPGTIDLEAPESRRSSVRFAPTDGDKGNLLSWKKALEIATEKLADEERLELETDLASECTVISVLKAAEDARKDRDESKWRYTKKNGEVVILRERFDRIVEGFDKYARIIDVAIQHHPDVTSLVWASARFLLQVYLNHKETVEKLEAALKSIINSMANCEFYANIYTEALNVCFRTPSTSIAWVEKLESALPQFYAAILVFAVKAKRYFTPSTRGKFTNPLKPFATTLQTYLNNVDETERAMKELAGMATMQGVKHLRYNTLNMVREMRDLFTEISDDKAKQWLNAVDPDPMYDFNKERRLEGTCEWIFKNESYNTWIHSNGNRDLWIVGIPGAGKSVLATNLLDKLRELEGVVVLFFFFRDGDNRTTSPLEMVASIIAQLIHSGIDQERLMRILKLRMESSSYFTNNASEPRDFKKLCATLIEMLQGYAAKVIILLDALDECSNPSDVATHLLLPSLNPCTITSQMMLPGIGELVDVRFLLTGRPVVHDIFSSLSNVSTIHMEVNDDIRRFVTKSVANNESLERHKEQIIATIYENSAGMFRYAALVLEELYEFSPVEISERLQTMPKGIAGMYELILHRLGLKGSEWDLEMRRRILMWVTMAFRPVTVAEMQYACMIVDGNKSFDPDQVVLPSKKQMLACCGSLLEVFDGNKLRFTHRTVKEFLLQPLEKLSEGARQDKCVTRCMVVHEGEAHASMAVTCVTQLFSKGLSDLKSYKEINRASYEETEPNEEDNDRKQDIRNPPFYYAVEEWLKHAKTVPRGPDATSLSQTLWKLVADFFWDGGKTFREWLRVHRGDDEDFHEVNGFKLCLHPEVRSRVTGCNGLHVAASYGLVDNLDWAHPAGIDFNTRDSNRWTPLIHAVRAGEEEAVMAILTKEGVDINSVDKYRRTALVLASELTYKGIVEILLRQDGIEVDHVSEQGDSALGFATKNESEEIVQMLKQKGATVAICNGRIVPER